MIGFFRETEENGCFSNWYPAEFDYAGKHYMNSEQFMMFQKAWQFHRYDIAEQILETPDPKKAKKLARDIEVPSDVWDRWDKTCRAIVKKGVKAKYAQNEDLLDALLGTGTELMAECSPFDSRWGIGIDIDDPDRLDVTKWKGSNYLGVILMEVREELRLELAESKKLMYIDYHDADPIDEWKKSAGELKRIPQYYAVIHAYADTLKAYQQKNAFYNNCSLYEWEIAMNTNMGGGLPAAGFFEMKQEIYEIARRLQHKSFVTDIFEEDPPQWGLRGMQYFWKSLKTAFAFDSRSMTKKDVAVKVKKEFERQTNEPLVPGGKYYVEEFAHGGMSSGYLSGDVVINEWIPELLNRLDDVHFMDRHCRNKATIKLIGVHDDLYLFVKKGEAPPYFKQKCIVYDQSTGTISPQVPVGSWTARVSPWRDATKEERHRDWEKVEYQLKCPKEESHMTIGKTVVEMRQGDITKVSDVEAIANAANKSLLGGGGVDGAIHRAAGRELLEECRTLGGCETGEAKITKGYKLPCKYVIHTVGPIYHYAGEEAPQLLANCYWNSLALAASCGIRSVAFPSISTGVYAYPLEEAAEIAVKTVEKYVSEHPEAFDLVCWVLFDDRTKAAYDAALEKWK